MQQFYKVKKLKLPEDTKLGTNRIKIGLEVALK